MDPLYWAILLMCAGLALAVLELFVPSGGMLGLFAGIALIAAIVLAFRHHAYTGLGFTVGTLVAVPALVVLAIQIWPKTPMGRRILLQVPSGDDVLPHAEQRAHLKSLVGKLGTTTTFMLPSGPVLIDGTTYDALSEGMAIDPDRSVRVVAVRGTRLVVRPSDDAPPDPEADDPLARPIESLGIDDDLLG